MAPRSVPRCPVLTARCLGGTVPSVWQKGHRKSCSAFWHRSGGTEGSARIFGGASKGVSGRGRRSESNDRTQPGDSNNAPWTSAAILRSIALARFGPSATGTSMARHVQVPLERLPKALSSVRLNVRTVWEVSKFHWNAECAWTRHSQFVSLVPSPQFVTTIKLSIYGDGGQVETQQAQCKHSTTVRRRPFSC